MSTSINQAICDAISDVSQHCHPVPSQIRTVEFRRGLAEIDVTYYDDGLYDGDGDTVYATIPSEDVLTALLQKLVEIEQAPEVVVLNGSN